MQYLSIPLQGCRDSQWQQRMYLPRVLLKFGTLQPPSVRSGSYFAHLGRCPREASARGGVFTWAPPKSCRFDGRVYIQCTRRFVSWALCLGEKRYTTVPQRMVSP